jgi:signal transduction histidine kinase
VAQETRAARRGHAIAAAVALQDASIAGRAPRLHAVVPVDQPRPRRAHALLEATNRFLAAADVDELGDIIIGVARAIFDPWKASLVLVGPGGGSRLVGSVGSSADEIDGIHDLIAARGPLHLRAVAGEEFWSDDADAEEFRARTATFGGRSSFAMPIVTGHGVAGTLGVVYEDVRTFDHRFRDTVRGLCAQAGLALTLVATRDELQRQADELERQTRLSAVLLQVSQDLAGITVPDEIPARLARAIRSATGASYSLVGRWDAEGGRIRFTAVEGLTTAQRQALNGLDASPERFRMIRGGIEGRANVRVPPFDREDVPVELVEVLGVTAIAGAPVTVDGRPWGVIAVGTTIGDPDIVATGAELLLGLASIATTAIGRAEAAAALARQASVLESSIAERTVQLREAVDELRLASQAKTELLANVSHELRTPMTAILGFSEVLLAGLDSPLTPEQRDDVETIDRSARHLLELIDDLIDVSRLEAGRVELRVDRLDVAALVGAIIEEIRPLAEHKDVALSLDASDGPLAIVADAARLREIILNLLGNAVKFTPSGGRIEVSVCRTADGVAIEVADTGIGIDPIHHGLVFEKFQRVSGPEYPGTGLGLSIAREFAFLHGGDISLESEPGLGSRFTLRLLPEPRRPHPAARDQAAGAG